jgi:hypothetical protein
MVLSCDLSAYLKLSSVFKVCHAHSSPPSCPGSLIAHIHTDHVQDSLVSELFATLQELGALLFVRAENIKSLCEEGRLVCWQR